MPRPMRPPWGHPVPPVWRGSDYKEGGLGGTLLTQVEAMEGAAQKEGQLARWVAVLTLCDLGQVTHFPQ